MKSDFLTKLWLEDIDGTNFIVAAPLIYYSESFKGTFTVQAGTQTDLMSSPDILRGLLPKSNKYNRASVLHDAGLQGNLITDTGLRVNLIKPLCDSIFLEALLALGAEPEFAYLAYNLVVEYGKSEPKNLHPLSKTLN